MISTGITGVGVDFNWFFKVLLYISDLIFNFICNFSGDNVIYLSIMTL
jgi:hypothetical protein